MRRIALVLGFGTLLLAACGSEPPPTQIVIVTATPDVVSSDPGSATVPVPTTPAPTATAQAESTQSTRPAPTAPPVAPTATRDPLFPTDVYADVAIAEQVFENGRMIWIRHNRQIWVMVDTAEEYAGGDWFCYNDTFEDGESEIDPALMPPEGVYQPRRGFGKLWRRLPQIKDALGWALTPEFELTSKYTYIAGGYVENRQYIPGPGEHRLTTLYNEPLSFFEGDIRGECQGGTWRKGE